MKEEEFQKKVLSKFEEIEKRLESIEEKLDNVERAMSSMYEEVEEEEYEGDKVSPVESEDNNITEMLPPHKNIKGYI